MSPDLNRRRLVLAGGAWLLVGRAAAAMRLEPTPAQTAGPFYPSEPPLEDDNDLTHVRGASGVAQGRITDLGGRLLDRNGQPIQAARIEIWQCDATGRYHHLEDRGGRIDPNFQGFGRTVTDPAGRYRFRTIRPVPYPGRTPHIHFAVFSEGQRPFTTQLYIRDEPRNTGDFVFESVPAEQRALVLADFFSAQRDSAELAARFDLILDVTPRG
ncbi:MAG: intradiol ring-cleavage dioxygenase [Candidatus Competibacteraceae bacterium]|nr:intradiol ring-cleavage dioxygenase [Candidatus Competibacteraceae bacterium]